MNAFKRFLFVLKFLEIRLRFVAVLVVTALVVGYWDHVQNYYERWQRHRAHASGAESKTGAATEATAEAHASLTEFFCPMHTFVVREAAGKCPICGMDLVPRKKGEKTELPEGVVARVQTSPARIVEAGVKVEPVGRQTLVRAFRAYGDIEPDETRQARIIAHFEGRIDELMVRATGDKITQGQPLAKIYSPKFLSASEEYLQALASKKDAQNRKGASEEDRRRATELVALARQRLRMAGFSDNQLEALEAGSTPEHTITLDAPFSGVVLERRVLQGDMVLDGSPLFTLADLSRVWIQARVLEADLGAVAEGAPVRIETVAFPGRNFFGTVDFVYPTVDSESRSARVRIVVPNPKMDLKPGMSVAVEFRSPVGRFEKADGAKADGAKAEPAKPAKPRADAYYCPMHPEVVSGKPGKCEKCGGMELVKKAEAGSAGESKPAQYTCPMHPEVLSDKPGDCPKCGMKLVAATPPAVSEDVWAEGYTCPMHPDKLQSEGGNCPWCDCGMELARYRVERPLAVPAEAVIDTGTRQVVYVESAPGVFDAKAVTLGARAGEFYPVMAGLNPGDRIAARGAFLLDAENRLNPQ